jgi:predicted HTH domain antitoxin
VSIELYEKLREESESERPMPIVSFELSEEQLRDLGSDPAEVAKRLRLAAAFHLCGKGQISTGKAARLAGLSYAEFLDEATRQKVNLYHYDIQEIEDEITRPLPNGVNLNAVKQSIARAQSAGN